MSITYIVLLAFCLTLNIARAQNACFCRSSGGCLIKNDLCDDGYVCPCDTLSKVQCGEQDSGVDILYDCIPPGGTGDPLIRAFDGSTFYFHGIHNQKYVIHATNNGDTLVAKMRATNELWMGINRTYFEQFGLRLAGSNDRLRFFLKRNTTTYRWKVLAVVNGKPLSTNLSSLRTASNVNIFASPNKFKVISPFSEYTVKGVSLTSIYRRHFDFSVKINKVHPKHQFSGILGQTVSKTFPFRIRKVDSAQQKLMFELKMRELYTVPTLFPSTKNLMKKVKFVTPQVKLVA